MHGIYHVACTYALHTLQTGIARITAYLHALHSYMCLHTSIHAPYPRILYITYAHARMNRTHACTHAYKNTHAYIRECVHALQNEQLHCRYAKRNAHTQTYVRKHVHVHTYICAPTHTRTRVLHIHTHNAMSHLIVSRGKASHCVTNLGAALKRHALRFMELRCTGLPSITPPLLQGTCKSYIHRVRADTHASTDYTPSPHTYIHTQLQ